MVAKALNQYVGDQVNSRLKTALGDDDTAAPEVAAESPQPSPPAAVESPEPTSVSAATDSDIVTTEEELEGFNIVGAIAVSEVAPERVVYRDAKAYMAILLDDNNRKPILRL